MASLQYIQSSTLQSVTLGSNYTAGDGSMTLTAGNGAYLPSSGDFWLSYNNGAGTIRLFKVTARSTDTLTVTAVSGEGSGDGNISSGETLRWALTVDALDQLKADIVASVPSAGFILLETQTASTSATLDFTSAITSAYDTYQFEFIEVKPDTNNVNFYMRASIDGGSTFLSTSIYQHTTWLWRAGASGQGGSTDAQLNVTFNNISTNASYPGVCGTMKLYAPLGTTYRKHVSGQFSFFGEGSAYPEGSVLMGTLETTSAVNAIRFYFSSGNIASGIIRCYGLSKP